MSTGMGSPHPALTGAATTAAPKTASAPAIWTPATTPTTTPTCGRTAMRRLLGSDLDVDCPMCGAHPGKKCRNIRNWNAEFAGLVHNERRQANIDDTLDALRTKLTGEVRGGV